MSSYLWNQNSRNRTPLNRKTTRTLKFKMLFPDYITFVDFLEPFGFKKEWVSNAQYNILLTMVGNAWLRYKTDVKNYGFIATKIDELYAIQEREQKIYDLDPVALMENTSAQEQRFFTINKSQQLEVTDNFLNNSSTSKITNRSPYLPQINNLLQNANMKQPKLLFLYRLANSITYPLQHNIINSHDHGKGY